MLDAELPARLKQSLAEPLPGRAAQRVYSHPQSYGRHFGPAPAHARQAAIMAFIYWNGSEWILPLIRRVSKGIHASQICFAGGGIDPGETAVEAALRECGEETGWSPTKADVVGQLSPIFVYASNNLVSCIVAITREHPVWNHDPREVDEVIDVPLVHIFRDPRIHETKLNLFGLNSTAPCFRWNSYDIWGATSMIISELKSVILP